MNCRTAAGVTLLVFMVSAVPLLAHHSLAGNYDVNKVTILKGVITSVEWRNPHTLISLNVPDANGKVTTWTVELGGASTLEHDGLDKNMFDLTKSYSIEVLLAIDGSKNAVARTLAFADGRSFNIVNSLGMAASMRHLSSSLW